MKDTERTEERGEKVHLHSGGTAPLASHPVPAFLFYLFVATLSEPFRLSPTSDGMSKSSGKRKVAKSTLTNSFEAVFQAFACDQAFPVARHYNTPCVYRLDTTLTDFTDMKCQRGDLSFVFNGNAVPSESFVVLDNEQKVYQRIHHEVREAVLAREFRKSRFRPLQSAAFITPPRNLPANCLHSKAQGRRHLGDTDSFCPVCLLSLHPGVRDGDRGGGGHPDEQRRVLGNPLHQVHHLLQGADRLALQGRQNGGCRLSPNTRAPVPPTFTGSCISSLFTRVKKKNNVVGIIYNPFILFVL